MQNAPSRSGASAFFVFLFAITILAVALIYPFLGVIFFSLIMVFILKPLYDRLLDGVKGRQSLAAAGTLIIAAIVPLALFTAAGSALINQMQALAPEAAETGASGEASAGLSNLLESMAGALFSGDRMWSENVLGLGVKLVGSLLSAVASLGFSLLNLLLNLIIFITIVAPLLVNYDRMIAWVQRLSPFPEEVDQLFINRIRSMTFAMFISIFVIAFAQSLVMGILYWMAGVQPIVLWMFLSFIASTLPFGNSIIALPLGIYLIATDNPAGGWILILGYLLIVSNMDTVMRPKLIPRGGSLVYVLALLSGLGGLTLFGYLGVIYGSVIMVTFVTALEVYQKYYTQSRPASAIQDNLAGGSGVG